MKPLKHSKALIFDMDGVLWNSGEIHQQAYRAVLEPLGVAVPPYDTLAGMRTDEVIRLLLTRIGAQNDEDMIRRLTSAKRLFARKSLQLDPPLMPRCREVLEHLESKYLLALASSASKDSVDVFLQASQTRSLFKVVVCGEDVSAAKPAPDIYLTALKRLGIAASEAYVIEDSESGINSAIAAGISVIVYRSPGFQNNDSDQIAAVIDSLDELLVL